MIICIVEVLFSTENLKINIKINNVIYEWNVSLSVFMAIYMI